jgi:alanine racemase
MIDEQSRGGRPTWAEIDLDALAHNLRVVRDEVGPDVRIMAAVKANAYGHGAIECARRLEKEGVDWFGVALPEEGTELRDAGITKPILCLGGFWKGQEGLCLQKDITPVAYRLDMIELLDRAARSAGVVADIHVKVDTGMGRLGVRADEVAEFCDRLKRFANIRVEGLMTHLASADDQSREDFTRSQFDKFNQSVETFREHGWQPTHIHSANSAAAFTFPAQGNMVRPGGSLYGFRRDVFPSNIQSPALRPVMSLHSRIMLLKRVPQGERLGYGGTFETKRDSLIATIPIGYNDGYSRALSNRGRVIIRGMLMPVVGRVSMDLTLVDVTDIANVAADDQVTLLGKDADVSITAEDIAETAGTISYEITCGISERVPRIYLK